MRFFSTRFLIGTLLAATTAAFSMPPPDPGMIEQYRKDGTLAEKIAFAKSLGNHRGNASLIRDAQYRLQKLAMERGLIAKGILAEPPPAWKDMPTTGKVKVLTICIDFNDYPHVESKNSIAQMKGRIFGTGDSEVPPPYESFREFYLRSSFGKLDFGGDVLGWFRPGYDRATMAETTVGREQLIKEALLRFDADGHDFSQYDNNHDGKVDFFSVIWSGPHGDWASFWWGYQTAFGDDTFKLDGVGFGKYSWQWESRVRVAGQPDGWNGPFSPKTLIHEQGHGLGLPDYYDYDDAVGPRGGVGGYDMMDWVGDHNCFSKWLLDWITPTVVNTTNLGAATKTLMSAEDHPEALLVMPDATGDNPFSEFFMIQNRQPIGNDANCPIPGSGLVVWHVDSRLDANNWDYLYDNSFTEHKLLRLMEADGLEQLETDAADMDAEDFYGPGKELGPKTLPNTSRYDGTYTNFGIRNITPSAPSMTFDIYTTPADTTAPTGAPGQPTGTSSLDTATFTWTLGTAADPEGLVGYYLQVGSTPGGNNIFDGRVGNVLTRAVTNLGLWEGKTVYARVKALNTAGMGSSWSPVSAGVPITLPVFANCADLDNCTLVFKTIGIWEQDTQYSVKGGTSAHGLALDNQQTTLQTAVTGPGKLSFWWKASTEKGFDYYSVMIDGVIQDRISGEADWSQRTLNVPAGAHVVSWRWAKDSNTTGALDKVWLDDVQYEQIKPLTITTQPGDLTVQAGTPATFQVAVQDGTAPYTYQWYSGTTPINGATSPSYTFVPQAMDDGRTFKVVVTDSTFTPFQVTSRTAKLTVLGGMMDYTEAEPNNTRYQANAIPRQGVVTGRIGSRHDIDVFKVSLKAGQRLDALMTCGLGFRHPSEILRLDCLDEWGQVVAIGQGRDTKSLSVRARRRPQTFFVRVYYGRRYETGDYQLELTF